MLGNENQEPQYIEEEKREVPEDLICAICKGIFKDAVMIPCCGSSFCGECVLESEECPDCKEKGAAPELLIPNRFLRNAVAAFHAESSRVLSRESTKKQSEEEEVHKPTENVEEDQTPPDLQQWSQEANEEEKEHEKDKEPEQRGEAEKKDSESDEDDDNITAAHQPDEESRDSKRTNESSYEQQPQRISTLSSGEDKNAKQMRPQQQARPNQLANDVTHNIQQRYDNGIIGDSLEAISGIMRRSRSFEKNQSPKINRKPRKRSRSFKSHSSSRSRSRSMNGGRSKSRSYSPRYRRKENANSKDRRDDRGSGHHRSPTRRGGNHHNSVNNKNSRGHHKESSSSKNREQSENLNYQETADENSRGDHNSANNKNSRSVEEYKFAINQARIRPPLMKKIKSSLQLPNFRSALAGTFVKVIESRESSFLGRIVQVQKDCVKVDCVDFVKSVRVEDLKSKSSDYSSDEIKKYLHMCEEGQKPVPDLKELSMKKEEIETLLRYVYSEKDIDKIVEEKKSRRPYPVNKAQEIIKLRLQLPTATRNEKEEIQKKMDYLERCGSNDYMKMIGSRSSHHPVSTTINPGVRRSNLLKIDEATDLLPVDNAIKRKPTRPMKVDAYTSKIHQERRVSTTFGIGAVHHLQLTRNTENNRDVPLEIESDSSVEEFEDALNADEDIFAEPVPQNRLKLLIEVHIKEEILGCLQFVTNYRHRFGHAPNFFEGTLEDAIKAAKDKKLLAIYLHHDQSYLSDVFCRQLLNNDDIVNQLNEKYILYGWDLTCESNTNMFLSSLSACVDNSASLLIRNTPVVQLPMIMVIRNYRATCKVADIIHGNINGDSEELYTHLIKNAELFDQMKLKKELKYVE